MMMLLFFSVFSIYFLGKFIKFSFIKDHKSNQSWFLVFFRFLVFQISNLRCSAFGFSFADVKFVAVVVAYVVVAVLLMLLLLCCCRFRFQFLMLSTTMKNLRIYFKWSINSCRFGVDVSGFSHMIFYSVYVIVLYLLFSLVVVVAIVVFYGSSLARLVAFYD